MRSSSAPAPTAWWPPTRWPTPGWDVVLVEANDEVGGAVRSAEVTAPGYVTDLFSAFYPLAAASPIIRDLHLEEHGLRLAPGAARARARPRRRQRCPAVLATPRTPRPAWTPRRPVTATPGCELVARLGPDP